MKKINGDLSINVLNIAAVEKRNNKCFLFMMDGDKYELSENDYDVIAAEVPTLKVDDNLYVNPNAVLTVETIYKNSNADHSIVKLVGDNVAQVTLAEGAIVAAMEPTSGGGSGKMYLHQIEIVFGEGSDITHFIAVVQNSNPEQFVITSLNDLIAIMNDNVLGAGKWLDGYAGTGVEINSAKLLYHPTWHSWPKHIALVTANETDPSPIDYDFTEAKDTISEL